MSTGEPSVAVPPATSTSYEVHTIVGKRRASAPLLVARQLSGKRESTATLDVSVERPATARRTVRLTGMRIVDGVLGVPEGWDRPASVMVPV